MQKELTFTKQTKEETKAKGLPTFNNCNHYVVDMSHLDPKREGDVADYMNTIVIKLPNGNAVTFCVMQTSKDETCIDTKFHGDNLKDHRVSPMGEGDNGLEYDREKPNNNRNIYALIAHAKEIK